MDSKILFPDDKVIVTEHFDVHQDWEVPILGFLIIASRRKVKSVMEFSSQESQEFITLLQKVRLALKDVLNIEEVYLFQNEGTHHQLFHIWLLPRHDWMKKIGDKIESIRPIIDYAKQNMSDEQNIQSIKEAVVKLRENIKL